MLLVEHLDPRRHDREAFACGEPALDAYLRQQAAQHHRAGISTTHVLVDEAVPGRSWVTTACPRPSSCSPT